MLAAIHRLFKVGWLAAYGLPPEALVRLLVWLSPATVGRGQPAAITLHEAG